jgi:thiol-disulfide isomerase/thioredoxin
MRNMTRLAPVVALAATLLLAGCGLQQSDSAVPNGGLPRINGPATPISAPTLSGTDFAWSSTHGHIVVLDFWGSWCGPCNQEQPQLNQIAAQWIPKGVIFLGVDVQDTNINGAAYERNYKVPYPSVNDASEVIMSEYNVPAPPTVVIIDAKGNIADHFLGTLTGITQDLTHLTA